MKTLYYSFIIFIVILLIFPIVSYHNEIFHKTKGKLIKSLKSTEILQSTGNHFTKLYEDQVLAWSRRSQYEESILKIGKELLAPIYKKINTPNGSGFSKQQNNIASINSLKLLAKQQKEVLHEKGVLRINNCLSQYTCKELRKYVINEQQQAKDDVIQGKSTAQSRFGIEIERKFRSDLLLSLLKPQQKNNVKASLLHPVASTLNELLGLNGKLRYLYEELVSLDGELYELAATITDPGSERQMIHPVCYRYHCIHYDMLPFIYIGSTI